MTEASVTVELMNITNTMVKTVLKVWNCAGFFNDFIVHNTVIFAFHFQFKQ